MPTARKKSDDDQGPAKALQRESAGGSALVPTDQTMGPLAPINIDITKIAQQANVLDTLAEVKEIIDDCAAEVELTEQNTFTTEGDKHVFQATRSVRIGKPGRATIVSMMANVTPWNLALVLGSFAIVGTILVLLF